MPCLKKEEMARHFWSQPLQKFRVTVTETVTRVYELEADNRSLVDLVARQHDTNRHSIPQSMTVIDHQVQVVAID